MPRPIYRLAFIVQRLLFDMRRRGRAVNGGEEKDMQPNVRSAPMPSASTRRPAPPVYKAVAIITWALACVTTWQLVAAVTPGMDGRYQVGIGVLLQVIFTALESPMINGQPNKVSGVVLAVDTLINAGGVYPFAMRAAATPTIQMISSAFNLAPAISPVAAFLLAALCGFLLAAAPEAVWRWRD